MILAQARKQERNLDKHFIAGGGPLRRLNVLPSPILRCQLSHDWLNAPLGGDSAILEPRMLANLLYGIILCDLPQNTWDFEDIMRR